MTQDRVSAVHGPELPTGTPIAQLRAVARHLLANNSPLSAQDVNEGADAIEYWMREALRYKHSAEVFYRELCERATYKQEPHIPDHDCGFIHRPDEGGCDFHEEFVQACDYMGYVDAWAEEAMLDAE